MNVFLDLVLKIAFSHLYKDRVVPEANNIYDSFFPKKQDKAMDGDSELVQNQLKIQF